MVGAVERYEFNLILLTHTHTHTYIDSHPQTDLFRSIRTHQCG